MERLYSRRLSLKTPFENAPETYNPLAEAIESPQFHRLLPRNLPFHQSENRFEITSNWRSINGKIRHFLFKDWFHVLLNFNTWIIVLVLTILWTMGILLFAGVYVGIDRIDDTLDCGLGVDGETITFYSAFAFSLETATTVGYGLPGDSNAFFQSCPDVQITIYMQMVFQMFFQAVMISFFFARLSRSAQRSTQVLFSNKMLINLEAETNQVSVKVQVCDIDRTRPIVEAHVRLYAVKHRNLDKVGKQKWEVMRLAAPDDELNGWMMLSLPDSCCHFVDTHSPLYPPSWSKVAKEISMRSLVTLRESDAIGGSRDSVVCPVCGESYGTVERLIRHIKYARIVEEKDEYEVDGTHLEIDLHGLVVGGEIGSLGGVGGNHNRKGVPNLNLVENKKISVLFEDIKKGMRSDGVEIVAVVEGIEPNVSGTFQAVQSYTIDDIEFDKEFSPCIVHDEKNGFATCVDLTKFHNTEARRGGGGKGKGPPFKIEKKF